MALPPMGTVTYVPLCVTLLLRGMPGMWQSRHRLVLCWRVVMQTLRPGRLTWAALARCPPVQITAWALSPPAQGEAHAGYAPLAQTGRNNEDDLWFFGIRLVLLIVN
jgi:hypothetical protein